MEHFGLSLSSHNNYIVPSPLWFCDVLLIKFLVLQWPGSKAAWGGGRAVAPNWSPGGEWIGMRHGGFNPAASCLLRGVCAYAYGSYSLNSVIYSTVKTILGDMRYKNIIKRFNSMDLLQPLSCIYPKYVALAQSQLTMLAAPSVTATVEYWSLFSCIYPGSTQPVSPFLGDWTWQSMFCVPGRRVGLTLTCGFFELLWTSSLFITSWSFCQSFPRSALSLVSPNSSARRLWYQIENGDGVKVYPILFLEELSTVTSSV